MMDGRTRDIVSAAYNLFKLQGYDQVSVLDICRACGMTKPTFYKYMSSKKNILVALFKDKEDFIYPDVLALYENGALLPALFKGLTFNHEVAREIGPELMVNYVNTLLEDHLPNFSFSPKMRELMEKILGDLISSGQIHTSTNPDNLYTILCSMDQGLLLKWTVSHGNFSLENEFQEILSIVLELKKNDQQKLGQAYKV
ncbi:MAG: TetR/AcrR family transcriptional regulator [Ileibacterium sp.]|nr:TetR/AcrR family transcriptional regulator [Ileibacterium sp.]